MVVAPCSFNCINNDKAKNNIQQFKRLQSNT